MTSRRGFEDEYPFASHYLDAGGVRMHYLDEGAGEAILFVHGNPTWSFAWRNFIKELSPGCRCVAPDHVGCGFSDKPQKYPYRLDQHISNLGRLVESLDLQRITLVAHDWGGAIGMGTAVRMPERFARIALMNTAAFRSAKIPLRIAACRIPILGALGVRGLNLFARAALRMAVCRKERMTVAVRAGFLAPYGNWADRVAILRFVQDIPLRKDHESYPALVEIEEGLAKFAETPILFLWGMRDWCFTPTFLAEFQRRFPHAETDEFAGAGHYVFEDCHNEAIARLRRFLLEHPVANCPTVTQ